MVEKLTLSLRRLLLGASAYGLYGIVGAICELIRRAVARRRNRKLITSTVPFPPNAHPFWGTLKELTKNSLRRHDWSMEQFEAQGRKTAYFPGPAILGPRQGCDQLATTDPAVVKWILKDNVDNYTKSTRDTPFFFKLFIEFLGKGIFMIDHGPNSLNPADGGKLWHSQRKTASSIFTNRKFEDHYIGIFHRNSNQLMHLLAQSHGTPIDIQDMFFKYTMDAFGELAFDTKFNAMTPQPDEFGVAFDEAHRLTLEMFFSSTPTMSLLGLLPPGVREIAVAIACAKNSKYRQFHDHCRILRKRSLEIITQRRRDPDMSTKTDLLALLMNSEDEYGRPFSEPSAFHDNTLKDQLLNFTIAGRDTTACTLTWAVYELTRPENEAILQKLVAEVDRVLGDRQPTYTDVKDNLPYLRGVLYEAMRLHPIVPNIVLIAQQDDKLPDGTAVAAGTVMRIFVYGMCRDASLYPDPFAFNPDRWIPFKQPSHYEFPVFKGGPRLCLGMNMAIVEASVAIASLVRRFSLKVTPGQRSTYSQMVTMSIRNDATMKHELLVECQPRQQM